MPGQSARSSSAANYSYRSTQVTGDGYILIGDAAAFIDPLLSSGVMLAMSSAAFAVEALRARLERRSGCCGLVMWGYERKQRRGLKAFSWLIYRINTPDPALIYAHGEEFDLFETRNGLSAILAGDFYVPRWFLSPLRRVQFAYAVLVFFAKLGFRLQGGRIWLKPVALRRSRRSYARNIQVGVSVRPRPSCASIRPANPLKLCGTPGTEYAQARSSPPAAPTSGDLTRAAAGELVSDATARDARDSDVTESIPSRIEQKSRDSGNKTDAGAV